MYVECLTDFVEPLVAAAQPKDLNEDELPEHQSGV